MLKAVGSKIDLKDFGNRIAKAYYACIEDIISDVQVKKLYGFSQHMNTDRFQHSLNVSYYSFLMAKNLGLDYRSAARGALLHDLFFYNFKESGLTCKAHTKLHPKLALENAEKICKLNKIERDIILKHMWPLTTKTPKYMESLLVTFADKYCATCEVIVSLKAKAFFRVGLRAS